MSNPWRIRWISFQWDITDCNILHLSETWLTTSVPDTAVTPSDNFSVLRMDRTDEAGKSKVGGVCFMINEKWCDLRNISRCCSPLLQHLSIIYIITGGSWWRQLGHVPGEFVWHHRVHRCSIKLCKYANRASYWKNNYKDLPKSETVGELSILHSPSS